MCMYFIYSSFFMEEVSAFERNRIHPENLKRDAHKKMHTRDAHKKSCMILSEYEISN